MVWLSGGVTKLDTTNPRLPATLQPRVGGQGISATRVMSLNAIWLLFVFVFVIVSSAVPFNELPSLLFVY